MKPDTLANLLIKHKIIQPMAIDDPEWYDAGETKRQVLGVSEELEDMEEHASAAAFSVYEVMKERDELRSKLEAAEKDARSAIASLNETSKFSTESIAALTQNLEAAERSAVTASIEVERLGRSNASMKEALIEITTCPTCEGSGKYRHECQACLSGYGKCTCQTDPPATCPQCEGVGKHFWDSKLVEQALSAAPPSEWVRKDKLMEALTNLQNMTLDYDRDMKESKSKDAAIEAAWRWWDTDTGNYDDFEVKVLPLITEARKQ